MSLNNPLINILVRTSARPLLFKRLIKSIKNQTYKNTKVIVSYDDEGAKKYIPAEFESVFVSYRHHEPAFYNRYCNDLKELVKEGYFVFIDDDDYITNRFALEKIVTSLLPDKANIVQMSRKGRRKPFNCEIVSGKIGMPCIILRSEYKHMADFDGSMNADYKFIKEVADIMGCNYIPRVLVEAGYRSMGKV